MTLVIYMSPLLLCVVMRWPHSALRRQQPIRVWQEPNSVCSPRIRVPCFHLVLTRSFVIPEYESFVLSKDTLLASMDRNRMLGLSLAVFLSSLLSALYILDSTIVLSGFYCCASDLQIQEACFCSGNFESHLPAVYPPV